MHMSAPSHFQNLPNVHGRGVDLYQDQHQEAPDQAEDILSSQEVQILSDV